MNSLLLQAIKKAGQMRAKLKLNLFSSVNIFDACMELGVTVRFIDVSMEGMYVNQKGAASQVILISCLRPLPRRVYTCAHELGHHIFGHGSKIDGLTDEDSKASFYDKDEYLVDAFAGAFLMPIAGIEAGFRKRNWEPRNASPIQFYIISSIFGTGYSTLITHCKANKLISEIKALSLLKQSPSKLLKDILGKSTATSHFKIIDNIADLSVIDLEIGNYLFLPSNMCVEGSHLYKVNETEYGNAFIAKQSGIVRTTSREGSVGSFIRVQNARYVGLAENRHLEDKID
jgi:Zn-dependent peptidase ImmA (M78 family)